MQDKKNTDDRQPGSESEPSFEELLKESFKAAPAIQIGDKVDTRVVAMDNDFVYLDLGTRMEGTVKKAEYLEQGKITIEEGDTVTVYITGMRNGAYQCARWFADADSISRDVEGDSVAFALQDAYDHRVPVEAKVESMVKGGFEVTVMGKRAFCPLSQIETGYCGNPESHLGKTHKFIITQLEESGKNIVLSRKEILLEEERRKSEQLWDEIEVGGIYKGTITNVKKYGAFVDIGGIQGLLHVSEISHSRTEDAQDVLEEGRVLDVEIISIDRPKKKIGFSLKSQMEDPWDAAMKKIAVGDEVTGKVIKMKSFGAFVEIAPGLVGLLHVSRLGTDKQHQHVKEVLNISDTITVRIMEIDPKKQTISLTLEKPERDFSGDLEKLKEEQEQSAKSQPGKFADQLDSALQDENPE